MKAKKSGTKRSKKRTGSKKARRSKPAAEERRFTESLIVSGEAARPRADGTLPPGATHEIVETGGGRVKAVRRRFSIT